MLPCHQGIILFQAAQLRDSHFVDKRAILAGFYASAHEVRPAPSAFAACRLLRYRAGGFLGRLDLSALAQLPANDVGLFFYQSSVYIPFRMLAERACKKSTKKERRFQKHHGPLYALAPVFFLTQVQGQKRKVRQTSSFCL